MSLGLAMIVRDCAESLNMCLINSDKLFDEIVIVDTGSTDNTKEIALQYTNKVHDFIWVNDFSKARNFSFDLMTTDFIMWLDGDDTILPEDQEKIKKLDYMNKEIIICPYHYSHDEFGITECILQRERIVKRSLGLKWQKPIHEYLPIHGKKISKENIVIHHNKRHNNTQRNLEILQEIVKVDKDPRNLFYLGKELSALGKIKEAIESLEKFVTLDSWWEDVFFAYNIIAKSYLLLNNNEKFFENIFKSIEIEPQRAEPYYDLGDFYFNKKNWSKAIFWYTQCITIKRPAYLLSFYYPQYYTWKPWLALCLCYNNMGNIQKAYECNEEFLKYRPDDKRGHNNRMILENSHYRFLRKDGEGKKLNLGCGNKRLDGYVNVDVVEIKEVDEVFDMKQIPYKDETISTISSEHSFEHLSFNDGKQAAKEFFRVLQPGGVLELYIPDLELCAKGYINADNNREINGYSEKTWYSMTLFGAQKAENGSTAEHQFHLSGYSKDTIKTLLEDCGFIIVSIDNY
jgi:tetratricopeptide (TPR) repeat protein